MAITIARYNYKLLKLLIIIGASQSVSFAVARAEISSLDRQPTLYLQQNWQEAERNAFYHTPQGSYIMPYAVAMHLKTQDGSVAFFSNQNLQRFGFIPQKPSQPLNPDGLPIGFTVDGTKDNPQLGINCAACHTGMLDYKGQKIRVDGATSPLDFQRFVREMDESVLSLRASLEKREQLELEVLGPDATLQQKDVFEEQLRDLFATREDWENRNKARRSDGSILQFGYGRTDAFGVILNQVLAWDLHEERNARPPTSPTKFPVIWDGPQHDYLQWIGVARNKLDVGGPLGRNLGQVLGVFGSVDVSHPTVIKGYCASAKRENLQKLEGWLTDLESPQWPEAIFGLLDQSENGKVQRGRKLFVQNCLRCHDDINSRDPNREVHAHMIALGEIKTDPTLINNVVYRTAITGQLEGRKSEIAQGYVFGAEEPAALVLRHITAGAMLGSLSFASCRKTNDTTLADYAEGFEKISYKSIDHILHPKPAETPLSLQQRVQSVVSAYAKYKARPLNGIWSAAPYFHNSSVKSLYEVLLPEEQRSKTFKTGCQNFDPVHVGIDCENVPVSSSSPPLFVYNTTIDGNHNTGHNYGAGLSEGERWDLLEYLKSL